MIIEPTSVELAHTVRAPKPARRLHRPAWLGIRPEARAAARSASWRATKAAGGRLLYELVKGIPLRTAHLVRWFVLGMKGWIPLIAWVFAVGERDAMPSSAPKSQRKPGQAGAIGRRADRLAWIRAGVLVVPHVAGGIALHHYLGPGWQYVVFLPGVIATIIHGRIHDEKPPAPVVAPRARQDVTVESLNAGLRAIGILAKPTATNLQPDGVTLVRWPRQVGIGQEVVIDLPDSCGKSAADVINLRGRLAAHYASPLRQFVVEQGAHEAQVVIWQSETDPFGDRGKPHPLLARESASVFDWAPFGYDTRFRPYSVRMFGTHFLGGGQPESGKSSAARTLSATPIMDPYADLYVFDGKQGRDWVGVKPIATVFANGPIREQAKQLVDLLESLIGDGGEGERRAAALRDMPTEECPDNQLTPAMAAAGMHFKWLVVDEFHEHIADDRYGDRITELLIDYVKGYRFVGFGLLLVTQDVGGDLSDRFTSLRRVITSRFAMRVADWLASNMILGDQMNTRGYNAAEILPSQKGTGIFRGDMDGDGAADAIARTVRTYHLTGSEWDAICEQGIQLRGGAPQELPELDAGEPRYAQAGELYELLSRHAPDVLGAAGATDAHSMGMRLPIKTEKRKVNRRRVYDLGHVEVALGLTPGCLTADTSQDSGSPTAPPSHPCGTPITGPESPSESPLTPSGTED